MLGTKTRSRASLGAGLLLLVGVLAGAAFPKTAASEASCAMQLCSTDGCLPTTNPWYCDTSPPGEMCITRECDTGELMCPPLGICQE